MKPARGELISDKVIIRDNKESGKLYQKSRFGQPDTNNSLHLSLIESAFLIEEKKLNVYQKDEKIQFDRLISHAAKSDSSFEEKYVVFRDLRKRGIQVQTSKDPLFTFTCERRDEENSILTHYFLLVISEREIPFFFKIKHLIHMASEKGGSLWLAIVDEEGDITYYSSDIYSPKGTNKLFSYHSINGLMLSNRVALFDELSCKRLHEKEFFGKPFGTGLQLSLVEALYLMDNHILHCYIPTEKKELSIQSFQDYIMKYQHDIFLRYHVYSDLKSRGLIVKTGFKFGTHFRAYQQNPFQSHAEYLVHTIDETYETQWPEISRAVRLAHAVNKDLLFALISDKKEKPEYIHLARIRP